VPVASKRTTHPSDLANAFRAATPAVPVTSFESLQAALNASKNEPLVMITGSLYLIGEALEKLELCPAGTNECGLNEWAGAKIA
jgi:folylpolyglutamate synthase/dihydropteroate synthase